MWVRSNHRPAAPALAEPSWGRVLATTVKLWVRRRRRRIARRWQWAAVLLALAAVAVGALQLAGVFTQAAVPAGPVRAPADAAHGTPGAAQAEAAAWIAGQVSNAAMIGCYPGMCAALQAQGVPAGRLVPLRPGSADLLRAHVVVTSASVGRQLTDRYAPALIASFGLGGNRIEVRATETGGAAAYRAALRADLAARESAGAQLLRNRHIRFTPQGAAQLRAGQVDSRLLATLAALSSRYQFRVTAFSDAAPGAQVPFREVTLSADRAADLGAALGMVHAQNPPYLPAHAAIVRLAADQTVLSIEFAAPSPLGLLTPVLTVQTRGK
jgi:hypothetical protein